MAKAKKTEMSAGLAAFAAAASVATAVTGTEGAAEVVTGTGNTAPDSTDATEAAKNTGGTPVGYVEPVAGKGTVTHNPVEKSDAQVLAESKAQREADAQAAKDAKAKEKADKAAAKEAEKAAKAESRAKAKQERADRLAAAAEGKNYTGSMLALSDRVKQGVYVKGTNGQLRSTDELAVALDGISATDVVKIGLDLLKLEDNPYAALNIGQQSMNLRNRMRGAIKKEVIKIGDIADYVTRNSIHVVTAESVAKAKADREAAATKRKEEADAKAKAKAEADAAKPKAADPSAEKTTEATTA